MSVIQHVTIEQIQKILLNPTDKTWVEVSLGEQSYRMQLGVLRRFIQNGIEVTQKASIPYWTTLPEYSVDDQNQTIIINAGGKIQKEAQQIDAAARTLPFILVQDPEHSRFDAVVFNLANLQYELIVGEESQNPVTPTYNQQTQLLLTYLLVDPTGSQVQTPANDHIQNTDQYLDFYGPNKVPASSIHQAVYRKLGSFLEYKATPGNLPLNLAYPYFAFVGDPVGLYVFDPATNTWAKVGTVELITKKIKAEAESADFTTGDADATGFWGAITLTVKDALAKLKNHFANYYSKTEVDNTLTSYATKTFVEDTFSSAYEDKGDLDCSVNPTYPAAEKGDSYYIRVGGKLGGDNGKPVQVADVARCRVTSPAGDEATVGTSWYIVQGNLDKATTTDMVNGTDNLKYTTPLTVHDKVVTTVKAEAEDADFVTGEFDNTGFWGGTTIMIRDALLKIKAHLGNTYTKSEVDSSQSTQDTAISELNTEVSRLDNYAGYYGSEATLPAPTVDSFALVGDPISLWVYKQSIGTWSRSGGDQQQLIFEVGSNLDNVVTILFTGPIKEITLDLPAELSSYYFEVKLDGGTYVYQAGITELQAWINANVASFTTKWMLKIYIGGSSDYGETSFTFNYKKA